MIHFIFVTLTWKDIQLSGLVASIGTADLVGWYVRQIKNKVLQVCT